MTDDPLIQTLLAPINLGNAVEAGMLPEFTNQLIEVLTAGTNGWYLTINAWYLSGFIPKTNYSSHLLPPFRLVVAPGLDKLLIAGLVGLLAAGIGALLLVAREVLRSRATLVPFLAVLAIWLFYALCVVVRIGKPDYESTLIVPLLVFAVAGSFWLAREPLAALIGESRVGAAARTGLLLLLILSVVSQASLIVSYYGYALGPWAHPGVPEGQRLSLSVFRYGELEPKIIAVAGLCGIDPAAHPRHLVVDEVTYFALRRTYQPIHISYIEEEGPGKFHPDPTGFLRRYKSAGMVVGCERVPTALRGKAVARAGFCCVPAFSLEFDE